MLKIHNLVAEVEGKTILKGLNLQVKPGEIHAIMGPNGAGKSTLAKVLGGHPHYEVTSGEVLLDGDNLLEDDPEERAYKGLFISFQYPIEVPGVSNELFLKTALNSKRKALGQAILSESEFQTFLAEKMALLEIKSEFKARHVNVGFSGGEKKRNEILQLAVLEPKIAILDETDSGLDIDALRSVGTGVMGLMNNKMGLIVITHYQRLLEYIQPHFVHIMQEGKIVRSGDYKLAKELDALGYDLMKES